jgi:hypothetical protein
MITPSNVIFSIFQSTNHCLGDGKGVDGIIGYCERLLIEASEVGSMLLARMFLYDDGWPPDDRTLTKEQNNKIVWAAVSL